MGRGWRGFRGRRGIDIGWGGEIGQWLLGKGNWYCKGSCSVGGL